MLYDVLDANMFYIYIVLVHITLASSRVNLSLVFANNKGADQPAHQRSLISTFVIRFQVEHSAILSIFIKLPFVIKLFVLPIFEWSFYTGFTVLNTVNSEIFERILFL